MEREEKLAKKLYQKYKTDDPFAICEAMGYLTVFAPLVEVRGFYQRVLRNHIIYIDEGLLEEEQRFVCAHELGHSLLHKGENAIYLDRRTLQVVGKYERSADRFAAVLLCPDDDELLDYADQSIDQLSALFGLPPELVAWRYRQIPRKRCRRVYL